MSDKTSNLTNILEQVTSKSEAIEVLSDTATEESKESKVQDESEAKLPSSICGNYKSQLIEISINWRQMPNFHCTFWLQLLFMERHW